MAEKKLQHSPPGMTRIPSSNPTSIYGNDFFELVRKNGQVPVKEGSSSSSTSSTITTKKTPSTINPLLGKIENNNNKHQVAAAPTTFKKPRIADSSNQQEFSAGNLMMNFSTFLRPSMLLANNNNSKCSNCDESNNEEEPFPQKQCKSVDHNSNSNNNKRKVVHTGFCNDPFIEYSSVCSPLGASNNTDISSRKQDFHDSIYLSENDEDKEDVIMKEIKKEARREGNNGVRRSKSAETHNLYERQRRDKINKKLRILKDLIPNCDKVDKASLLDDAIEYLKVLKLHLQIMTMGTGLCMAPMMLPNSSPQQHLMNTAQLQHLMGLRHGISIPSCNMPHHQFPSIIPPNGVGMFGFPNQFLPMMQPNHPFMSHAPFTATTIHPMLGNNNNNNNIFAQTPLQTTNNVSAP